MKKLFVAIILISLGVSAMAQPTYHDEYSNYYLSVGYQSLYQKDAGHFTAWTASTEVLYGFFGSRASFAYNQDYLMFSPVGLMMFMPSISCFPHIFGPLTRTGPTVA